MIHQKIFLFFVTSFEANKYHLVYLISRQKISLLLINLIILKNQNFIIIQIR
jgi:hypothetical protein